MDTNIHRYVAHGFLNGEAFKESVSESDILDSKSCMCCYDILTANFFISSKYAIVSMECFMRANRFAEACPFLEADPYNNLNEQKGMHQGDTRDNNDFHIQETSQQETTARNSRKRLLKKHNLERSKVVKVQIFVPRWGG